MQLVLDRRNRKREITREEEEDEENQLPRVNRVDLIHHNSNKLILLSHNRIPEEPQHLGAGELEMVLNGDGHVQRSARVRLGHQLFRVRHRTEFHAERESSVLRLWAEEELPELCLVGAGSAGLDYHV